MDRGYLCVGLLVKCNECGEIWKKEIMSYARACIIGIFMNDLKGFALFGVMTDDNGNQWKQAMDGNWHCEDCQGIGCHEANRYDKQRDK